MLYLNGHIYVTVTELEAWGVPIDTIKYGCRQFRQGNSSSWANIPDPSDKRRVLVDAETIPATTRVRYRVPYAEDLLAQYQQRAASATHKSVSAPLDIKAQAMQLGLSVVEAERTARLAAWLTSVQQPPKGTSKAQHCHQVVAAMQADYAAGLLPGTTISNADYLEKLARKYAKEGLSALINKRMGNKNAERLTDDHKLFIYALARQAQKLDDVYVHQQLELAREAANWSHLEPVSIRTVRRYINQPQVHAALFANKYGKAAASMSILPYAKRSKPMHSLSLLVGDGYSMGLPVSIPYGHPFLTASQWAKRKNKQAMRTTLMVFIWFDVATGAIVGYDFDIHEPAMLVRKALRNVLATTGGKVPLEVMADRKIIANAETKAMLNGLGIGFDDSKQPYAPWQNIAERYNKEVSKWLRRTQSTWVSITNHHADYVHNPEHARASEPISLEAAMEGFADIVALYNADVADGQPTKLEDCLARVNPECQVLDELNRIMMFGQTKKVSQRNGYILISLGTRDYTYELPRYGEWLLKHRPESKLWVHFDEDKLDSIQVSVADAARPDDASYAHYWGEAEQAKTFNMAGAERTADDNRQLAASVAHKRQVQRTLEDLDAAMMAEAEQRGILALGLAAGQEQLKRANSVQAVRQLNEHTLDGWAEMGIKVRGRGNKTASETERELVFVEANHQNKHQSPINLSRLQLLQERARRQGLQN